MTFRQMELFIAVCENKSISKASDIHFISQQGISKMIRELEQELNCILLNRTKNGVIPTENGVYFLGECKAILERKKLLLSTISNPKDFIHETIFLGMAYGMIAALPRSLIANFEKQHEFVSIAYSDHTDLLLETLLQAGDYDFCVTAGILDSDSFSSELLFSEDVFLCIPKKHELFYQNNIEMQDLKEQHFAMFSTQFHIRHNFTAVCKNNGFEPMIDISSSDFNSLKEIAAHDNLLFVVPEHTIVQNDNKYRYYKFPDATFLWNVYFTKKNNKKFTANMTAFYNFLKESIAVALAK